MRGPFCLVRSEELGVRSEELQENETSIVGDDACDIPNPFHSTSPTREANEAYCRGGACSSRDLSIIIHQTA